MKLKAADRKRLNNVLSTFRVLQGTQKVKSVSEGLAALTNALAAAGYTLDMVTGDIVLGEKGSRLLPFRLARPEGADAFTEGEAVENSRISFSWENLTGDPFNRNIEVIAYAS